MAEGAVYGLERVLTALRYEKLKALADARTKGVVSYSVRYALRVHEELQEKRRSGESKFLEKAYKRNLKEISRIIHAAVKRGRTLPQAMLSAAQFILRESNKLVPVLTGRLKRSGRATLRTG